jgi:hypothetical protein
MHALRIGHQGSELITTGRISLPVTEPVRSRLLPEEADRAAIDDFLIGAYRRSWDEARTRPAWEHRA